VEGSTGVESQIGSFQLTNEQRQWIWDHREVLTGQIAEVRAMKVNESGAIRAGVFVRFHPSRSEAGLLMYAETLAGRDAEESRSTLYKLKNATGRRRNVWTDIARQGRLAEWFEAGLDALSDKPTVKWETTAEGKF
jgi:hypothetical protein